ncbi:hypothetical protein FRC06_008725, partial [Ceratobasidium sp. 370]
SLSLLRPRNPLLALRLFVGNMVGSRLMRSFGVTQYLRFITRRGIYDRRRLAH